MSTLTPAISSVRTAQPPPEPMAELAQADVPPGVSIGQRLQDRVRIDTDCFPNLANSVLPQKLCVPVDPCGHEAASYAPSKSHNSGLRLAQCGLHQLVAHPVLQRPVGDLDIAGAADIALADANLLGSPRRPPTVLTLRGT